MLGEEISIVEFTREPFTLKFIKTDTAANPMVAHCDGFRFMCSKLVVSYTGSAFIVGDEDCWGLRITERGKNSTFPCSGYNIYVEGSVFSFRNSTADGRNTAADAMKASMELHMISPPIRLPH